MNTTLNLGAAVLWELGNQTRPDMLRQQLDALGVECVIPTRTWRAALKSAVSEEFNGRGVLVRPVKEHMAYTVIIERKEEALRNEYGTDFTAKVDGGSQHCSVELTAEHEHYGSIYTVVVRETPDVLGNGVTSIRILDGGRDITSQGGRYVCSAVENSVSALTPLAAKIRQRTEWFKTMLPAAAVSEALVAVIEKIGGCPLRSNGGLYHLPPEALDTWEQVTAAVSAAAAPGCVNDFITLGVECTDETVQNLRKVVVDRLSNKAARIADELRTNEFTDEKLQKQRDELLRLRQKAESYGALLQDSLEGVKAVLTLADTLAGHNAAAAENDVFGGLMTL